TELVTISSHKAHDSWLFVTFRASHRPIGLVEHRASDALSGGTIRFRRGPLRRRGGAGGVGASADREGRGVCYAEHRSHRGRQHGSHRTPAATTASRREPVPRSAIPFSRHAGP